MKTIRPGMDYGFDEFLAKLTRRRYSACRLKYLPRVGGGSAGQNAVARERLRIKPNEKAEREITRSSALGRGEVVPPLEFASIQVIRGRSSAEVQLRQVENR
jgi:hypothetical protein